MIKFTKDQKELINKFAREHTRPASNSKIGHIYLFSYKAKTYPERLKYYDKYPLVLILHKYDNGFLGLALHYLPPKTREFFIKKLLIKNLNNLKNGKPVQLEYWDIKNAANLWWREGIAIIHKYLNEYVRSRLAEVPYTEWLNIVSGEGAQWVNASAKEVFADTRARVRAAYQKSQEEVAKAPKLSKTATAQQKQIQDRVKADRQRALKGYQPKKLRKKR